MKTWDYLGNITWDELSGIESRKKVLSYTQKHLYAHGLNCTIERDLFTVTKVFMKRATKSTNNLGNRDALFEGIMPAEKDLRSGDLLTIGNDKYLVQSVNFDLASKESIFFAAKCNTVMDHLTYTEELDKDNIIKKIWTVPNANVHVFGGIVTYELRQFEPGLLSSTRYVFQVPRSLGIKELDRLVYNGKDYQVDVIDDIGLPGVDRVQVSVDVRGKAVFAEEP